MTSPNWITRPASTGEADVGALTHMLNQATRTYLDRPTTRTETLDRLATPGCDLSADSVLVCAGEQDVLGFAQVFATPPADVRAFARVRPDARGQGVGRWIAAWTVARASELAATLDAPSVRFSTTAWAADSAAAPVLRAAGLAEIRHFLRMVTDLPGAVPDSPPPAGVSLEPYRPSNDDDALFDTFRESFAEHWGQEQPDEQGWWWDEREAPNANYDPTLWTMARAGGEIVGFVLARTRERQGRLEGYVSQIGVRPAWRSRRLGQALLGHALQALHGRGLAAASLDVDADNVTDALRLYRRVGMTAEPAFTVWGKVI
ncbi:MAG: GNAT family N-acetyltransferase [Actinomycetota bacterium]|nr:GNAT family N-acetyltransferase [Actinomycetota bacterium]